MTCKLIFWKRNMVKQKKKDTLHNGKKAHKNDYINLLLILFKKGHIILKHNSRFLRAGSRLSMISPFKENLFKQ